jgi:hypothetical protein
MNDFEIKIGERKKIKIVNEIELVKMNEIEFDQIEIPDMILLEEMKMNEILLLIKKLIILLMILDLNDEKKRKVDLISV